MKARDQLRLARLRRIERLREVERLSAARSAAEARAEHARLEQLAQRMEAMHPQRPAGPEGMSGGELAVRSRFVAGLARLAGETGRETLRASRHSDETMARLGQAQHRRDLVSDKVRSLADAMRREGEKSESPGLARFLNNSSEPGASKRPRAATRITK